MTPGTATDALTSPVTGPGSRLPDLRMPLLAAAAWVGSLASVVPRPPVPVMCGLAMLLVVALAAVVRRRPALAPVAFAAVVVGGAVFTSSAVHHEAVAGGPVAALAAEGAVVTVTGTVVSDPHVVTGPYGDLVVVRLEVHEVVGRGLRHRLGAPVVVLGDPAWARRRLGEEVRARGRLRPDDEGTGEVAGLLTGAAAPTVVDDPSVWWDAAAAVRASIRDSVEGRPDDQRALVPSLVVGDDAELDEGLVADFKTTGLTHLTAVSGTNLTLLVGFLLVVARWCGVRGRWLVGVAALGIVGFVLVARTEPSVLRAAAMGTVGLLALATDGRQRALRGLGVAVVVLLLLDPALGASAGFALSVLATAGIVVLGPGWRDALARWLPRWLAEAVAVPAAAQLACTPVVAALSGQVSLVAVVANLLVAPAVGPATVLGLAAGLLGLLPGMVGDLVGTLLGTLAGWCVGWIAVVARSGADVPGAAVSWGTGPLALGALVGLSLLFVVLAPRLLGSRRIAVAGVGLVVLVAPMPGRGPSWVTAWLPGGSWPPTDWLVVACDVGQGDALAIRAGPASAVLVDVGPDPAAVDRCLDRLELTTVPLLVLTHFHADHVDGLVGAMDGRSVGQVWTTNVLDPPDAVDRVVETADSAGLVPTVAPDGSVQVGEVSLQTLWPRPGLLRPGAGDGTSANDASVVLLAEVGGPGGVRVLLTGDLEPPGQAAVAREVPGLDVDVLKVPHHGSRYQDLGWLASLRPEVALVSVGEGNDYGHPASATVDALVAAGADVERTDEHGDLAVVSRDGEVGVVVSG